MSSLRDFLGLVVEAIELDVTTVVTATVAVVTMVVFTGCFTLVVAIVTDTVGVVSRTIVLGEMFTFLVVLVTLVVARVF